MLETYQFYLMRALQIIQFPLFLLYVLFVLVLLRHRKELATRFYDILISLGIAELIYAAVSTTHRFLITSGIAQQWSTDTRKVYRYSIVGVWNGAHMAQLMGVLLIALNRFTAIVFPVDYETIWHPTWRLNLALGIQWTPSLLYLLTIFSHPSLALRASNISTELCFSHSEKGKALLNMAALIHVTSVCILVIALHTGMLIKMLCSTDAPPMGSDAQRERTKRRQRSLERRLALIGVILGVSVTYFALMDLLRFFLYNLHISGGLKATIERIVSVNLEIIAPVVDFVFTFCNPCLVLAMSAEVRRCFGKFFRFGTAQNI